jgi:hypothetical protein
MICINLINLYNLQIRYYDNIFCAEYKNITLMLLNLIKIIDIILFKDEKKHTVDET